MIEWMNQNQGFLMVTITFVYVVATIFICVFNWKSASASRKQVEESQKQQKQNVGLQLYSKRKEVIEKLSQREFELIFWDVPLLFSTKISDDFIALTMKASECKKLQLQMEQIEQQVDLLMPRDYHLPSVRIKYIQGEENVNFAEAMKMIRERFNKESAQAEINGYEANVEHAKRLEKEITEMKSLLFIKMQDYIKKSIGE